MYIFLIHNSSCNLSLYLLWSKKTELVRKRPQLDTRITVTKLLQVARESSRRLPVNIWRNCAWRENNDVSHRVKKIQYGHPTGCFYTNCGELDTFETLFQIRFGKTTVMISYLHRHHGIERFLKYDQETSSGLLTLKQPRKLEVQDLYRKK